MVSRYAAGLKPPLPPAVVLLGAILLPGVGQALNNTPWRGLMMTMFGLILGLITYRVAAPQVSMVGHVAGGLFVYAISVMDAYYWARVRRALFQHR
jgi:hypothetical protein